MFLQHWPSIAYLYVWPESERLKKAIQDGIDDPVHTIPVIRNDEPLKDEVSYAIQQLQLNQPPKQTEYSLNKNGLKALIKEKRLKAAFNLTTQILSSNNDPTDVSNRKLITFEIMEIWNCRFQLLMAIKMHKLAFEEMVDFGELDAPDFYLQYHAEYRKQGLTGSLIPFNMRLIHAEIPKYSGEVPKAYKRFGQLEESIQIILSQAKLTQEQRLVWKKRQECVDMAKARLLFALNNSQDLIDLYRRISSQTTDHNRRKDIQKMLIKLAAVWGNVQLMDQFCLETQSSGSNSNFHRSLKSIFMGRYQEACLSTEQKGDNSNASCNNNAVCLLYLGHVKESIDHLLNHPETPVLPILLNLFTVAELTSTKTQDLKVQHFAKYSQQFSDLLEPRTLRIIK